MKIPLHVRILLGFAVGAAGARGGAWTVAFSAAVLARVAAAFVLAALVWRGGSLPERVLEGQVQQDAGVAR